jgi:WD40 repeat protein
LSAIFLSHSSSDRDVTSFIGAWLHEQGYRSVFLDFDPEHGIPGGRDWEKELYGQLRTCRAVIVLCSGHSMTSPWCFAEITHARALGKVVLPVKVAECEIHALLRTAQVIDFTADRHEALSRLSRGLKAAGLDPADSFDWDDTRPPYPGLLSFEEEDAGIFFGREKEIREALDMLDQQRRFGGGRFMLLLGASGSGKSSLLRAGIIPRLRRNPDQWFVVRAFRPLGRPFENLAYALAESFQEAGTPQDRKTLGETIGAAGAGVRLAELANELRLDLKRPGATVLLVVDQLEELFTLSGSDEAQRFLETLRGATESNTTPLLIVATLRSDFLGELQKHAAASDLTELLVNPMPLLSIGQIIEGPAVVANLELGPGLVAAMLQDVEAENALPLLAFTLRELWERRQGNTLTLEGYRDELGGLSGSVARAAEGVLTAAKALTPPDEADLRRTFLSLVRVNDEGGFTRQPARWADLPVRVHPLLERFVNARLLVSRHDNEGRTLEVAHEALFRSWQRLAQWLDQDRAFLLWRKRLDQALEFWILGGKRTQSLLVADLLHESHSQLSDRGEQLNGNERAFIAASIAADRRVRNRNRAVAGTVFAAVTLALAVAIWQYINADRQRRLAVARQLAAEAQGYLQSRDATRTQRSLFLATASLDAAWTDEGFKAWSEAFKLVPPLPLIVDADRGPYTSVTFSPDGTRLAAAGENAIVLFDGSSLKQIDEFPQRGAKRLCLSSRGQFLAAAVDRSVVIWDVSKRQRVHEIPTGSDAASSIAFDSRANRLAIVISDSIRIFDTRNWNELTHEWQPTWPTSNGASASGTMFLAAFSPDDRWLLSAGASSLVVWDLDKSVTSPRRGTGPAFVRAFVGREFDTTHFLSFSTNGRWLAADTGVWSVTPAPDGIGLSLTRRGIDGGGIVAVNARGDVASGYGEIAVWQTDTGGDPPRELARIVHEATATSRIDAEYPVAFNTPGDWLITGGRRLERWDLGAGAQSYQLRHEAEVLAVASSRDGRYVATSTADGSVHIWNTSDWTRLHSLEIRRRVQDETTPDVIFSSDNRWVVATSGNVLKMFATSGWNEVTRKEYDHPVNGVAFSSDGRWVIATGTRASSITVDILETGSWRPVPTLTHERIDMKRVGSGKDRGTISPPLSSGSLPSFHVSVNPGGDQILTVTRPYCSEGEIVPGIAYRWRIATGERTASVPLTFECAGSPGLQTLGRGHALFKDWAEWSDVAVGAITIRGGDTLQRLTSRDGPLGTSESAATGNLWLNGALRAIALAQNGRWLVTTEGGKHAGVWPLSRTDIITASCSRLRRVGYAGQEAGVEFVGREALLWSACPEMRDVITYMKR